MSPSKALDFRKYFLDSAWLEGAELESSHCVGCLVHELIPGSKFWVMLGSAMSAPTAITMLYRAKKCLRSLFVSSGVCTPHMTSSHLVVNPMGSSMGWI